VECLEARGARLATQQGSRLRFEFPVGTDDIGQRLFLAARQSGAEVRGFKPAQRSLQDIFMEAVEE